MSIVIHIDRYHNDFRFFLRKNGANLPESVFMAVPVFAKWNFKAAFPAISFRFLPRTGPHSLFDIFPAKAAPFHKAKSMSKESNRFRGHPIQEGRENGRPFSMLLRHDPER